MSGWETSNGLEETSTQKPIRKLTQTKNLLMAKVVVPVERKEEVRHGNSTMLHLPILNPTQRGENEFCNSKGDYIGKEEVIPEMTEAGTEKKKTARKKV